MASHPEACKVNTPRSSNAELTEAVLLLCALTTVYPLTALLIHAIHSGSRCQQRAPSNLHGYFGFARKAPEVKETCVLLPILCVGFGSRTPRCGSFNELYICHVAAVTLVYCGCFHWSSPFLSIICFIVATMLTTMLTIARKAGNCVWSYLGIGRWSVKEVIARSGVTALRATDGVVGRNEGGSEVGAGGGDGGGGCDAGKSSRVDVLVSISSVTASV